MIRKLTTLDRAVRNIVIGVGLLALMFTSGLLANWVSSPAAVDVRWAQYSTPVVGTLNDNNAVTRLVDEASGIPVANENGTVTVVTRRCGPVSEVPIVSSRTWLVEQPKDVFLRIEGDTIAVTVPPTVECDFVQRDFQLPQRVESLVVTVPESQVTVSVLLQPLSAELGAILLESEPFHRWEPDRVTRTETLEIQQ